MGAATFLYPLFMVPQQKIPGNLNGIHPNLLYEIGRNC